MESTHCIARCYGLFVVLASQNGAWGSLEFGLLTLHDSLFGSVCVLSFEFDSEPLVDELSACEELDDPEESDETSPTVFVGFEVELLLLVPPVLVVVPPVLLVVGFDSEFDVPPVALLSPWV